MADAMGWKPCLGDTEVAVSVQMILFRDVVHADKLCVHLLLDDLRELRPPEHQRVKVNDRRKATEHDRCKQSKQPDAVTVSH